MPSGICIFPCCEHTWWGGPGRETESLPKAPSVQGDKHPRAPKDDLIYSSALPSFLFFSLFLLNLKERVKADEIPSSSVN